MPLIGVYGLMGLMGDGVDGLMKLMVVMWQEVGASFTDRGAVGRGSVLPDCLAGRAGPYSGQSCALDAALSGQLQATF